MPITVTLPSGKGVSAETQNMPTVWHLQRHLASQLRQREEEGPVHCKLVLAGTSLQEEFSLEACGVHDGCTLFAILVRGLGVNESNPGCTSLCELCVPTTLPPIRYFNHLGNASFRGSPPPRLRSDGPLAWVLV